MPDPVPTAEERLVMALAGKPPGERKNVEVEADDIVEVAARVLVPQEPAAAERLAAIHAGAAAAPGLEVTVPADNLYWLLELAGRT
jgi:hypothetical protein